MMWDDTGRYWILHHRRGGPQAAIDKPEAYPEYPKWSVRIRMPDVSRLHFDPELSLDEVKAIVQTIVGAQT